MISKKKISDIRALHLDKNRKQQQLFIAEGEKVVFELLNSGLHVEFVAATEKYTPGNDINKAGIEYSAVSEADLLKISLLKSPNKVLAIARIPQAKAIDYSSNQGILLVLDGINDPGNLGTLIRTADWFGVRNIMCSDDCVDAYNPKVVQSAMGSLFRMNVQYGNLEKFIDEAKASGHRVFGAAADGVAYQQCQATGRSMLVIGSESHGIRPSIMNRVDVKTGIPRNEGSKAESLNAGIAGAILLAHFSNATK